MNHAGLFERTHILVGDQGLERLQRARVLLAGLGGVGSYAAEALVRAGVGHLTLLDFDVVSRSNLNRQLPATEATVGRKKVEVMGQRLAEINPHCHLDLHDLFLTPQSIPGILDQARPDWVIDAIDTLNCKVGLIVESLARGVRVASSMGAGGRLDPTQLVVGDLMDSHTCPLAREVRNRVRRRGVERGVVAVWSPEPPVPHLPPEPTVDGRARAINGTISYLPALFGMTLAGTVVQAILLWPTMPPGDPPPRGKAGS